MSVVHVVDDIQADRQQISCLLEKSWKGADHPGIREQGKVPEIKPWRFIWEPLELGAIEKGDVVISDLYPEGYWQEVPQPTLYERSADLPDDPTNLYKAALDVIQRFMREVPKLGAHLVVVTYIPNWIGGSGPEELEIPVLADKVREVLQAEDFEFFEKEEQLGDEDCFRKAIDYANGKLEQR